MSDDSPHPIRHGQGDQPAHSGSALPIRAFGAVATVNNTSQYCMYNAIADQGCHETPDVIEWHLRSRLRKLCDTHRITAYQSLYNRRRGVWDYDLPSFTPEDTHAVLHIEARRSAR